MKLGRKQSLNVGDSLLFVNIFPDATGWFCHIQGSMYRSRSRDVLLFDVDQTLMQEQFFQVVQADPGHVRALCLGSPCV